VKILICTDGTKTANSAVRFGGIMGKCLEAETTLLHVKRCDLCGINPLRERLLKRRKSDSDAILAEGCSILESLDLSAAVKTRAGTIEGQILAEANGGDYDLVVIGSEGVKGIEMLFFGALSYKLVENIRKPILVVKKGRKTVSRVLICTGGSAQAKKATEFGGKMAKALKAKVTLLHVVENNNIQDTTPMREGEKMLEAGIRLLNDSGVAAEKLLLKGKRSKRILETARRRSYDLIIMGQTSMNPVKMLSAGSVVYEVLKNATVPCLIVK
jgi:nucleotide-binding universal stress UspA family protein